MIEVLFPDYAKNVERKLKKADVRIFWHQWYTKSNDEYVAFKHLMDCDGKLEVVNAGVS